MSRAVPIVLMAAGGIVWLVGELLGVRRKGEGGDTTSEAVWWLQEHMPFVRILVGIFVMSLFGHFWAHTPLLP